MTLKFNDNEYNYLYAPIGEDEYDEQAYDEGYEDGANLYSAYEYGYECGYEDAPTGYEERRDPEDWDLPSYNDDAGLEYNDGLTDGYIAEYQRGYDAGMDAYWDEHPEE